MLGQDDQDRAARKWMPAQDCKDKIVRTEQKGEDSQKSFISLRTKT
jgi:hypothetical protein